jgi:hypothetical protein
VDCGKYGYESKSHVETRRAGAARDKLSVGVVRLRLVLLQTAEKDLLLLAIDIRNRLIWIAGTSDARDQLAISDNATVSILSYLRDGEHIYRQS